LAQRLHYSGLILLGALLSSSRRRRHSPRTYHQSSRSSEAAPMSVWFWQETRFWNSASSP